MTDKNDMKKPYAIDAIIFDVILFCFFLLLAITSLGYNPRARSIPMVLGILGAVMMLLQFLVDTLPGLRSKLRFVSSSGLLSVEDSFRSKVSTKQADTPTVVPKGDEPPTETALSKATEWWMVFRIVLWLVGFIVLVAYTNYLIAVAAFIIFVTKFEAKESWKRAIGLAFCVDLGFFILFDLLLQAQL
jgi:hypothetical protein